MSFTLGKEVDSSKVFIAGKNHVSGRWDPHFHSPRFSHLDPELDALNAKAIRSVAQKIFSGITPLSGGDAYTDQDDGVAFVRSGDFNDDGTINEDSLIHLKPEIHQKLMRRSQLDGNDVLFAIVGVTIGKVGIFPGGYEANINQAVCAVRPTSEISPHFLHAFFLSRLGQDQIDRVKRPVARANINLDEIGSLRIPVLDEQIQATVVGALKNAFAKKVNTEAKATKLLESIDDILLDELGIPRKPELPKTLERRIFQASFADSTGSRWDPLFHLADVFGFVRGTNYELVNLGHMANYFITGFPAGREDQVHEDDEGIIQIRPTNLSNDRELIFSKNVFIDAEERTKREHDLLQKGEVLFNNTNSQEQVGKTVWFDLDGDYFSSNHITRIGTKSERLNPRYLTYLLNLYQRQKAFFKLCTNWNNQSGVGSDILQRIPIPTPKPEHQTEIVMRLDAIREQANDLRTQAQSDLEYSKREIEAMILGREVSK